MAYTTFGASIFLSTSGKNNHMTSIANSYYNIDNELQSIEREDQKLFKQFYKNDNSHGSKIAQQNIDKIEQEILYLEKIVSNGHRRQKLC